MKKKIILVLTILTMIISLSGCGTDPTLVKFKDDINRFCDEVAAIDKDINSIDASNESAKEQLLDCLDRLDEAFKLLSEISIPKEFSFLKDLTKEASDYMSTAVSSYHDAYSNNSYNEYTADYARENYERAYKRIKVIIKLLHGEDINDSDVLVETQE